MFRVCRARFEVKGLGFRNNCLGLRAKGRAKVTIHCVGPLIIRARLQRVDLSRKPLQTNLTP